MKSRVGSVLDHLAAAIVALAVFALPISIVVLAKGHDAPWFVLSFSLAVGLTAAAVSRLVKARGGLPTVGETLALLTGVGIATWLTAAMALYVVLSIVWSSSRCTGNAAGLVGTIGAIAIYTVAGGWALANRRSIAYFVMPAGVVVAAMWSLLAWRFLPAMPGCVND